MLKKLSSVLILALALGGQHFLVSSAFAQDATAPATEAAPADAAPAAEAPAADTAAPAADAASVIDAANDSTVAKETPHGMEKMWNEGDVVTRGVLILMVIMSAATWYISAIKLMVQSKLFKQAVEARKVWDSKSFARWC